MNIMTMAGLVNNGSIKYKHITVGNNNSKKCCDDEEEEEEEIDAKMNALKQ